jgi:hypothetical protein
LVDEDGREYGAMRCTGTIAVRIAHGTAFIASRRGCEPAWAPGSEAILQAAPKREASRISGVETSAPTQDTSAEDLAPADRISAETIWRRGPCCVGLRRAMSQWRMNCTPVWLTSRFNPAAAVD